MISKKSALKQLLGLAKMMPVELIAVEECLERVLAKDVKAKYTAPPSDVSAMDGYAINSYDKAGGKELIVVGEASAGKKFEGKQKRGEAVRIFTGAPLPKESDCIVLQEEVHRKGTRIVLNKILSIDNFVRIKGLDFSSGDLIKSPLNLKPADISLLAAMNYAKLPVFTKPRVALIATGNELVVPGTRKIPNKIIASNAYGLSALLTSFGANPTILPLARDEVPDIQSRLLDANSFDLILTIGGASVGDYDLVKTAAVELGLKLKFHKVAIKPGKPLLAGSFNNRPLIGLPGNPVSAMVCCQIMVKPVIRRMLGFNKKTAMIKLRAKLTKPLARNGIREHFIRGVLESKENHLTVCPLERQDSSLLSELRRANALIVRPPEAPSVARNEYVNIIPLFPELD